MTTQDKLSLWEAQNKDWPIEDMDLHDLKDQAYEDSDKIENLISHIRSLRECLERVAPSELKTIEDRFQNGNY
jgi:hypothetical protein